MGNPRHYLTILDWIEPFARRNGAVSADWAVEVFNDITERGTALTYISLAPNDRGPRIGLCGDRFFVEAGRDSERPGGADRTDGFFISKVLPALAQNSAPSRYLADIRLLRFRDRFAPPLDPIGSLFASVSLRTEIVAESPREVRQEASGRLASFLTEVPEDLRAAWRPRAAVPLSESPSQFLAPLRMPWMRFGLHRYTSIEPREENLLRHNVTPSELSSDQQQKLLGAFQVRMLNAFAATNRRDVVHDLLRRLAPLALHKSVRSTIWAGMLRGLDARALRRELHECSADLSSSISEQPDGANYWAQSLVEALRETAEKNEDTALSGLLLRGDSDIGTLQEIVEWAAKLMVAPEQAESGAELVKEGPTEPPHGEVEEFGEDAQRLSAELPRQMVAITSPRPPADQWLSRILPDAGTLREQVAQLIGNAVALEPERVYEPEGMIRTLRQLDAISRDLSSCVGALPSADALDREMGDARATYARAKGLLGDEVDDLITGHQQLGAADLDRICQLLAKPEFLASLPAWLRDEALAGVTSDIRLIDWAAVLTVEGLREILERLSRQAAEFGAAGAVWLSQIAAKPDGANLDDHLSSEVDRLLGQWSALAPAERDEVTAALWAGAPLSSALVWQRKLAGLAERVDAAVYARIAEATRALPVQARLAGVEEFATKIDAVEAAFGGSAVDATFDQINRARPRQRIESKVVTAEFEVSVEHDYTDIPLTRAPLVLVPHPDIATRPYAFVSLPLVIYSTSRRECTLKWEVAVTSRHQIAWASDWDQLDPPSLHLKDADWREPTEGTGFIHAYELRLPVRPDTSALNLDVTLSDAASGRVVSQRKSLSWDLLRKGEERITVSWDERPNANAVRDHPIGPQKKLSRILDRLRDAGSFAITAPRRFGKTSLVKYLHQTAGDLDFACPEPIVCTSYVEGGRLNSERLWRDVSMRLQEVLGTGLKGSIEGGLPVPDAFDDVRRAARRKKRKGVLLLFDEAQLLFPRVGGTEIGFRLKDLIEWNWATSEKADGAPVAFGLIGLPDLTSRGGANLTGLLRTEDAGEMDEKDLNSLLLGVTRKRLYTTREARFRLVRSGSNLYLVKLLLDDLVDRANASGRAWINFNDVAYVENQVARRLEAGYADTNVGLWVRDALNDAEDVNYWQPMASFPVALALAKSRHEGVRGGERLRQRALELLNQWCADQPVVTAVPHYDESRLNEHLEVLRDRRMFLAGEFQSRFLEAWLVGQGREGYPATAKAALVKGAALRVKLPDLEPMSEGAQAKLFRCIIGQDQFAVRRAELKTDNERALFMDSIQTLQKLTEPQVKRDPGSQYLFDLEVIGFSETDDCCGVQMYRWIEGEDLQMHVKSLSAALVADLGAKLSQGLSVLERHGILHRDIAPRNIILATHDKRPVLIDFGLARLEHVGMLTNLPSEYAAPEVQSMNPQWSRAADVYALGKTLQALLSDGQSSPELHNVLSKCTSSDRAERPDVSSLNRLFAAVRLSLHIDETRGDYWRSVVKSCGADADKRWFWTVVEKFKDRFEAFPLGLHKETFDRAVELADFFNQLFEAFPRARGEKRLELGYVKQLNPDTGDAFAAAGCDFLHGLRTYRSHAGRGRVRSRAEMLSAVGNPSPEQIGNHVQDTAARMAGFMELPSLTSLSELLLVGRLPSMRVGP